ncbi:hypothetical protein [Geodermatophilus amargosae]|uniref:hypothetical protein n=1 Tax=Geodermatophilus amargosae TaxID=1296565 RepID=UPI0034DEAA71
MAIDRAPAPSSATLPDDLGLAGLLGLLDRAHELPQRRRPRRAAGTRSPGAPRALRPLPVARPVPVPRTRPVPPVLVPAAPAEVAPVPASVAVAAVVPPPVAAPGPRWRARLRASVRRLALWGAGPDGVHAAWPTAPVVVPPAGPGLVRRLALWGGGADGEHLAWGRPRPALAAPAPAPAPDRAPAPAPAPNGPVVLTELPSTPTVRPAASSPAAAPSPADSVRPVPSRAAPRSAGPALAPAGWPARPAAGRPTARAPDPPGTAGAVRTRGDPGGHPARGSPRPPPPAPD